MSIPKAPLAEALIKVSLLFILLIGTVMVGPQGAHAIDRVPIPELALWESNMLQFGRSNCTVLMNYDASGTLDQRLASTYYDGTRVYYQINTYTGDPGWKYCAGLAKTFYRDLYVLPNNGAVPGYWNFTHGLRIDYERNGDSISQNADILLSQNAMYAADYTPLANTVSASLSREVAYAIMSYINAEKVGAPPRTRLPQLVDQALGHIDQWFISKTYRCPSVCDPSNAAGQYYIQPFMVGLTAQALIMYYDKTGDARVLPNVKLAMDWLWANAWVPANQSFWYQNWVSDPSISFPPASGAPDLNLIIAPAYAWVYFKTGDTTYRDRGDQVFAGGVKGAWLGGSKQFDQNYWWSFDYVAWRRAADNQYASTSSTTTAPTTTTTTPTTSTTDPTTSTTTTDPTTTTTTTSTSTTTSPETNPQGKSKGWLKKFSDLFK